MTATAKKERLTEVLTIRFTPEETTALADQALLRGVNGPSPLAGKLVREGLKKLQFPAVDFRDGRPGRVAYLAGTRWPVWMIVELVEECGGSVKAAAKHMNKPPALVKFALDYAKSYPEEISAALRLAAKAGAEAA